MPEGLFGRVAEMAGDENVRRMMEGVPEELREKMRELRDMPPGERRKALRDAWERAILDAEKGGDKERAARLREMMERFEKGRDDRPGKGPKGERPANPDRLRAEIKELEDQGRFDEAKRLRKQLEAVEPARAPGTEKADF
jgi:hypothetical protein